MRRLNLLDTIEHFEGSISTGNLGNILPMDLPDVVIRAHSCCIFPSDTSCRVSINRRTMTRLSIHITAEDLMGSRRVYGGPVSHELKGNFEIVNDDHGLSQDCD
jgi:hypothetical protein